MKQKKPSASTLLSWTRQSEQLGYRKMMLANDPALSKRWNELYKHLIINNREFDINSKEIILLCLLTSLEERNGRIHIKRAREAGVNDKEIAASISLAGTFETLLSFEFVESHWIEEISTCPLLDTYILTLKIQNNVIDPKLIEIMGTACHAAKGRLSGMRFHLIRAFELGATSKEIAEALSYLIMMCSIPKLNDAVEQWEQIAEQGLCPHPYPQR